MTRTIILRSCTFLAGAALPTAASAFFFIIPIPNLAKPPALNALIEALEKSDETKAVAYVSEDKTFGSKYWTWSHYAGHVSQNEANRIAMSRCEAALARARAEKAGGKELYDFGSKKCELHDFQNKTVSAKVNYAQPPAAPFVASQVPPSVTDPAAANQTPPAATAPTATEQAFPAVPPYPYAATKPDQPAAPATSMPQSAPHGSAPPPPSAPSPAPAAAATEMHSGALAAQPPASAASPQEQTQAGNVPPVEGSAAHRLRQLNDLLRQGLITDSEYNEKRRAILSTL